MKDTINLTDYGLDNFFLEQIPEHSELFAVRVLSQFNDLYKVLGVNGELQARVSGRMMHVAQVAIDYPAVGDWVMVDRKSNGQGDAIIHQVLNRRSVFTRMAAGNTKETQIIAANVDTVFICMALNLDYNLRRLERYLSIAVDSGAESVVILTKVDLCTDLPAKLLELEATAPSVRIIATSSLNIDGIQALDPFLIPGNTIAFIGSSGVGKSTLINRLLGSDVLHTLETRQDDKGRHATTNRQLIMLANGAMVIDTPGMRELHLDTADISQVFTDIEQLASSCRFYDCSHVKEPGCQIQMAIETGELSAKRLESYQKLQKELDYQGLNSKQLEEKKIRHMFGSKGQMKQAMANVKKKNSKKPRY